MTGDLKTYSLADVAKHNTAEDLWVIMDDKVYDLTKFVMEHPGGDSVLIDQAGLDATESFNDVGHSSDAREMAKDYLVGKIDKGETVNARAPVIKTTTSSWSEIIFSPTWSNFLIPVGISILVYLTYKSVQRVFPSI